MNAENAEIRAVIRRMPKAANYADISMAYDIDEIIITY